MAKMKNVERKIWDIEGFNVIFQHRGKDVHGAKQDIPQYPFSNTAKNDMTVNEWKQRRFQPTYPGYEASVLDGEGNVVQGNMKLSNLRDTYTEEE